MAKIVCDTDAVRTAGKDIVAEAENMAGDYDESSKKIEEITSGWEAESKDSFASAEWQRAQVVMNDVATLANFGFFLQYIADSIDELEEQLATIDM